MMSSLWSLLIQCAASFLYYLTLGWASICLVSCKVEKEPDGAGRSVTSTEELALRPHNEPVTNSLQKDDQKHVERVRLKAVSERSGVLSKSVNHLSAMKEKNVVQTTVLQNNKEQRLKLENLRVKPQAPALR